MARHGCVSGPVMQCRSWALAGSAQCPPGNRGNDLRMRGDHDLCACLAELDRRHAVWREACGQRSAPNHHSNVNWSPCDCEPARAERPRGPGHLTVRCRAGGSSSVWRKPRHEADKRQLGRRGEAARINVSRSSWASSAAGIRSEPWLLTRPSRAAPRIRGAGNNRARAAPGSSSGAAAHYGSNPSATGGPRNTPESAAGGSPAIEQLLAGVLAGARLRADK